VADHAITDNLTAGFFEIACLEETLADQLDQIGMVIASMADFDRIPTLDLRARLCWRPILSNEGQSFVG
jgi:hypothetical protein